MFVLDWMNVWIGLFTLQDPQSVTAQLQYVWKELFRID